MCKNFHLSRTWSDPVSVTLMLTSGLLFLLSFFFYLMAHFYL